MIRALIIAATLIAPAHSWYPSQCCGQQDCQPVPCDQLVEDKDGRWLYIPTGNRFDPLQVKPSEDRYCHVCLGLIDKRSLCAFIQTGA
jgi:hypothetical protein